MRKNFILLLLFILPFASMQAQIINDSNKDKIGKSIKNGFNSAMKAIKQDAHPTGEHSAWDGYVGPKLGLAVSSLPGAGGRPELGLVAGGFIEVFLGKNISLSVEIAYQHLGANNVKHTQMIDLVDKEGNVTGQVPDRGKYNYNLDYVNTAYLVHWYPWPYRPASFYTGMLYSRLGNASARRKGGSSADIDDDLFDGEIRIPIGASYEWKQWQLDARYFISPRKLASDSKARAILGNARNMAFELTVAYRIQVF